MFTAQDSKGRKIRGSDLSSENKNNEYFCRHCNAKVHFVNGTLVAKHFRHEVLADCLSEPETNEHIEGKRLISSILSKRYGGSPEDYEEHRVKSGLVVDVFLQRDGKPSIAFEIQATSVNYTNYGKKIERYQEEGFITVYLFVPRRQKKLDPRGPLEFCNPPMPLAGRHGEWKDRKDLWKKNIFRLKEIEIDLFNPRDFQLDEPWHYPISLSSEKYRNPPVVAAYLIDKNIFIPNFHRKRQKGGPGLLSKTVRIHKPDHFTDKSMRLSIEDFIDHVTKHNTILIVCRTCGLRDYYYRECPPESPHSFERVCSKCDLHRGWVSKEKFDELEVGVLPRRQFFTVSVGASCGSTRNK
tara:strand:- start:5356 stop:6417 length:1062 start_codon:yes stop_codon:yes gene_type:complete